MSNHDMLVAGLRAWSATHDAPIRAAVELLIAHGHWLHDEEFLFLFTGADMRNGWMWIDWRSLAHVLSHGDQKLLTGSSSEVAVLRFATSLARDSLGLSSLDRTNRQLAVRALADALGAE